MDRANLGRQAVREFEGFETPDDRRKFTELYNVRRLASSGLDMGAESATKVHVSTIQRIYSILRGEELDEGLDELSGFDVAPDDATGRPVEVAYNPAVPIESYDVIIIDECHRSIYGVWRQVLEYFDAFLVGLTATPGKQTLGFFDQNLVMEYGHERAVADRVNVDYDIFRIRTEIGETGGTVDAGMVAEFRDRETREQRFDRMDDDLDYAAADLDRRVVAPDQIRTVIATLRDSMPTMFDDRTVLESGRLKPHTEDADLRQGRQPRRRHRPDRPRGVRAQQHGRREDHLPVRRQRPQARGAAPAVPHRLRHPHRRHRRHDRHRHRRETHRVRRVHAHGPQPQTSSSR